jgi:autotransporter-associated beta strand protein
MNSRSLFSFRQVCLATTGLVSLFPGGISTAAAQSFWNPDGTGGDGNWGTSPGEKNWNTTAGGPAAGNTFWQDGIDEIAVFQDAVGGIVTVIETVQATGIRQTGAGYTINAGTIVLAAGPALERPFVDVQAGTLTIDSQLEGNAGLLKTGAGELALTRDSTFTGLTTVAAGRLVLASTLDSAALQIGSGAELINQSGGLSADIALSNSGRMTLNVDETVSTYVSNGGELASSANWLDTGSAELNEGSVVSGRLRSGSITSDGTVLLNGRLESAMIDVRSGVLTQSGILDASPGRLNLHSGATLVAGGTQQYGLLTTSGAGAGTWQGNLANSATVAPGGHAAIGALRVEGDFVNRPAGTLSLDVGTAGVDLLTVTGVATFGGTLDLKQLGPDEIEAGLRIQVIQAGGYAGNFNTFSEDLAGTVIFNPLDGSITRLEFGGGTSSLSGVTPNQASTWAALYDDVVDPETNNVQFLPFTVTSGIASAEDPDLLWALGASITPDGLDRALLDRLSPEVYAGLSDYAVQAARTHRRSAFEAPALARGATAAATGSKDAKGFAVAPQSPSLSWEIFAATDYFDGETSGSLHPADYSLTGHGVLGGVRLSIGDRARIAAYLAGDDGEVRGSLIDADGRGGVPGIIGEFILEKSRALRLTGGISYGSYTFDGTRGSASATAAGWSPGLAGFTDVESEALDLFVGLDAVAWRDDRFLLMPAIGLNYTSASTDAFREFGGAAAGSPIALAVDRSRRESLVSEFSLAAQAVVTETVALDGRAGFHLGINDDPERLSARLSAGGRPLAATATPLANDLLFLGMGVTWTATDTIRVRLGYRAEFRSDAETMNAFNLGATFGF